MTICEGGLANVLAAAEDDRIKAIVSLDGLARGARERCDISASVSTPFHFLQAFAESAWHSGH